MADKTLTKKKKQQLLWGAAAAVLLILLDRFTKMLAVRHLKGNEPIVIFNNVFELFYLENHGAAFGILQGQKWFLVFITAILSALILFMYWKLPENKRFFPMRVVFVLLTAGAFGNFIDRCAYNYVVDFFYFKLIDFPVFNVADIYVTVAAVMFVLLFCFYYSEEDVDAILPNIPFFHKKNS